VLPNSEQRDAASGGGKDNSEEFAFAAARHAKASVGDQNPQVDLKLEHCPV